MTSSNDHSTHGAEFDHMWVTLSLGQLREAAESAGRNAAIARAAWRDASEQSQHAMDNPRISPGRFADAMALERTMFAAYENTLRVQSSADRALARAETGQAPGPAEAVCAICQMPATRAGGTWQHLEIADAVFCSIIRGEPITVTED